MTASAWVATRKGLFEWQCDASGTWSIARLSFAGEPVSAVLPDARNGRVYAALNLGHFGVKLHRSDDRGAHWEEIAAPAFPAQPEEPKDDVPWKLVQIWCLTPGAAHAPDELWIGSLPGGLFHSTDGGASWHLVDSLWQRPERREWFGGGYDVPGIHSICIDPRDAGRITLGISCGGVWRSDDGGAHWSLSARGMRAAYMPPDSAEDENTQDPHRIAQCTAAPEVFWCQHHNGIWRSTDGARHWTEITGAPVSNFGFAVAAHPQDPLTAWFVPALADQQRVPVGAALCVNRTRDGGKTFETLRDGLPQAHCYDLIYRHALAVDDRGQTLAMGSTTGNLYFSNDAGTHWTAAPAHLPPIAAVALG